MVCLQVQLASRPPAVPFQSNTVHVSLQQELKFVSDQLAVASEEKGELVASLEVAHVRIASSSYDREICSLIACSTELSQR